MIKKNIDKKIRKLLKGLLNRNHSKRLNIDEVLEHDAFRDNIWELIKPISEE